MIMGFVLARLIKLSSDTFSRHLRLFTLWWSVYDVDRTEQVNNNTDHSLISGFVVQKFNQIF